MAISFRFRPKKLLLLFLLLSLIVFGNSLLNDFVFDDLAIVRDRPELRDVNHLPFLLFEPYHQGNIEAGIYRPGTMASFALNHVLLGHNPWSFHLVNILLHGTASWLVAIFAFRITKRKATGLLAGLLFLVLPIHTEAVNEIVGRAEILSLIFGLMALLWIWPRDRNESESGKEEKTSRISKFFMAAVFLWLALLSKESAVGFIPLYFTIALLKESGKAGYALKKYGQTLAYFLVALFIYLGMRFVTLGSHMFGNDATVVENPLKFAGAFERTVTAIKILGMYAVRIVWPAGNLSSDYSYDQIPVTGNFLDPLFLLGFSIMVTAVYGLLRSLKENVSPWTAVAGGAFLFFFFPVANIVFPIGTIMGERLMYAPSLGFCILASAGFSLFSEKPVGSEKSVWQLLSVNKPAGILVAVVLMAYGALTMRRNFEWRDEPSLFFSAAERSPNSVLSRSNKGAVLLLRGELDLARKEIEAAQAIYPRYNHNLNNLGLLYLKQGDLPAAKEQFKKTLRESPGYGNAIDNLALTYCQLGEEEKAKRLWQIIYGKQIPGIY